MSIPDNYVDMADSVIKKSGASIGSTKLRNLFGLFCDLYNEVQHAANNAQLNSEQVTVLTTARIRMIYECGRDANVKAFVTAAQLIEYLMGIGKSVGEFISFYHYFEALVAYHKYYVDKD